MEHDVPQPQSGPPRDALQRLLRLVLNGLGFCLLVLWPLTAVAVFVLPSVLPSTLNTVYYLLHVFLGLTALIFLRLAIIGVLLVRAPSRINPKLLRSIARRASQPRRLGQLYVWIGLWLATYFVAGVVLYPWSSLSRPSPLSALPLGVLGAALPIVLIIALGPVIWHRMSERRRRRVSAS